MAANLPAQIPAAAADYRRPSVFAPFWAVARLQIVYCILQIRNDLFIPWLTALVEMLVARQLWIALFNGRATYDGYTLDQTLTYVVLSMAITHLLVGDGVQFLHWKIRSGNILFELMRPLHFTLSLLSASLSSVVIGLFKVSVPLLLMAVLLLKVPLPTDPLRWLVFALSFLLGCLIYIWVEMLAGLLGFWTTETHGLEAWMNILIAILSGAYLPLWIFPDFIQRLIAYLPFRGIQYVPLSILVGWTGPDSYLRELAIQTGWVVILALVAEGVYRLALRQLKIQGG
jgi:ABC-2 type transport system permease protein